MPRSGASTGVSQPPSVDVPAGGCFGSRVPGGNKTMMPMLRDSPRWQILGRSDAIDRVRRDLPRIAKARRTTLITGPTGSGKEVVARVLHELGSAGRPAPFVPVHCGAMPEHLAESELFGHTRGAFTGADHARSGLLRSAAGGTLFLDEVDALSLAVQAKLLRFLEDGEVRPVGSDRTERVGRSWVLAASNRDLGQLVARRAFREDLLFRLDFLRVSLPPLADRGHDVLLLAHQFLDELGQGHRELTDAARAALCRHTWPGNVRELKHRVERAALSVDGPIDASDLGLGVAARAEPPGLGDPAGSLEDLLWNLVEEDGMSLGEAIEHCEHALIHSALRAEDDNRTRAAARLGIHVRTIFKKLSRDVGPDGHGPTGTVPGSA